MKKGNIKGRMLDIVPVFSLVLLAGIYLILMGDRLSAYVLQTILNQTIITAIVSTGAIFIYTTGAFDISLGAAVAVSAIIGVLTYNATESVLLMFLVTVGMGVLISTINSSLAAFLNLPVFVTTIAMLSVLNALVKILITSGGGATIEVPKAAVAPLDTIWLKLLILVIFIGICVFIYNYTFVGRTEKFLGGNPVCAKLTGISVKKMSVIAFVVAGVGIGLSAFLTVVRAPTLSTSTASSIGMDVIIAIVFGGMPVSGGARSKISAAVIGSLSMVLLGQIMVLLNYSSGISQFVKSVLFLAVVTIAGLKGRKSMLAR